jgi:two-component system, chemotaxis family, chemotaxis protein CheY
MALLEDSIADLKALVVDDNRAMRAIVKDFLMQMGIKRRSEAEDGKAALRLLRAESWDLVVCDWVMPQMTGLELLTEVRADEKLKKIPFIMVTSQDAKENVIEAIKAGVSDYVTKPFNFDTFRAKIERTLTAALKAAKKEKDNNPVLF